MSPGAFALLAIEQLRERVGVPRTRLALAAGIHPDTYRLAITAPDAAREWVVREVIRGWQTIAVALPDDVLADCMIRSAYCGFAAALAIESGLDPRTVPAVVSTGGRVPRRGLRAKTADLIAAERVRREAIYLVNTELAVAQATIARLFGISPPMVNRIVASVEASRDDAVTDGRLARVAGLVTGSGHASDR